MNKHQNRILAYLEMMHVTGGTANIPDYMKNLPWSKLYYCFNEILKENARHEKFTRWLIGEIIKGELDEEATLNKLVEYGFAESNNGYISVRVEV